jgi:spore coat protein U-like protein
MATRHRPALVRVATFHPEQHSMSRQHRVIAAAIAASLGSGAAVAAETTTTFGVQIAIEAACTVSADPLLDLSTVGLLNSAVDSTADLTVLCTDGVAYNIGLNAGANGGGVTLARAMVNGTDDVTYDLFSDVGRSTHWGNTILVNTVASTGTGANQTFTVYGRVPVQDTPPAGTYTDTVTVTVTY